MGINVGIDEDERYDSRTELRHVGDHKGPSVWEPHERGLMVLSCIVRKETVQHDREDVLPCGIHDNGGTIVAGYE